MSANQIVSAPLEKKNKLKRARNESDSNNDESKKRGRPRLDTQDESTADVSSFSLPLLFIRQEQKKRYDEKEAMNEIEIPDQVSIPLSRHCHPLLPPTC
jgi:hypothetical protein